MRRTGRLVRTVALPAAAVLGLLSISACGDVVGAGEELQESRTFAWSGDTLRIDARHGDLEILPGTGGDVEVERTLRGKAAAEGNASWSLEDSTLKLRVDCGGLTLNCESRYEVLIPEGVAVKIDSEHSDVRVADTKTTVTADARHGDVEVENAAGTLRLSTEHGDVRVDGGEMTEITATSVHGDINLSLATPPKDLVAESTHGDANVELPPGSETYRVTAKSDQDDVTSELTSDPGSQRSVVVTSTHGDVRLSRS